MVTQCRHIRTSGTQCGMIAMRSQNFCYYHQNSQPRPVRSTIRPRSHTQTPIQTYDYGAIPVPPPIPLLDPPTPQIQPPVQLLFPEDRASIQINLYRISVAQAENRIDTRTANSMTWNQQVCMANLARQPLIEVAVPSQSRTQSRSRNTDSDDDSEITYSDPSSSPSGPISRPISRVILTPEGDEIAPPVEILEDNEAEPIHHRLCPCLLCAEKYRNQPPELHHPECQCGLCEEQISEHRAQSTGLLEGPLSKDCHPERSVKDAESKDLRFPDSGRNPLPAFSLVQQGPVEERGFSPAYQAGPQDRTSLPQAESAAEGGTTADYTLAPTPYPLPRIARASALLSGSPTRDPLNRPWSVAEYTFGDAIRRHEAQYAARAAAALAVGIEPPPYQPYVTGLLHPGTPEHEEDRQMQQQSSEYWAEHFRKQIADRPDIQQYLDEEAASESGAGNQAQ